MKAKTTDGRFVDFEFGRTLHAVAFERVEFSLDEMHEYNMNLGRGQEIVGWTWFLENLLPRVVAGGTIEIRTQAEKL